MEIIRRDGAPRAMRQTALALKSQVKRSLSATSTVPFLSNWIRSGLSSPFTSSICSLPITAGRANTGCGDPQRGDYRRTPKTPIAALHESGYGIVSRVTPVHTAVRNCTRDEGRPFEVGNQVLISSHRKLLSSKAMVVNVAEKSERDFGRYD